MFSFSVVIHASQNYFKKGCCKQLTFQGWNKLLQGDFSQHIPFGYTCCSFTKRSDVFLTEHEFVRYMRGQRSLLTWNLCLRKVEMQCILPTPTWLGYHSIQRNVACQHEMIDLHHCLKMYNALVVECFQTTLQCWQYE